MLTHLLIRANLSRSQRLVSPGDKSLLMNWREILGSWILHFISQIFVTQLFVSHFCSTWTSSPLVYSYCLLPLTILKLKNMIKNKIVLYTSARCTVPELTYNLTEHSTNQKYEEYGKKLSIPLILMHGAKFGFVTVCRVQGNILK